MTYHTIPTPRLSGSILYTLISVLSLTLITACGGGGLSLDVNLSTPESRLLARCAVNPFTEECHNPTIEITERSAEIIADTRAGFITGCVEDATSVLCEIATEFTCEGETGETNERGNPFAPLCQTDANEATYESERISITAQCIDPSGPGLTSRFCLNAIDETCKDETGRTANPVLCAGAATDQTIVNTCDSDIFNSACDGNPTYIAQRRAFCGTRGNEGQPRCTAVISSTCTYDANDANNTGNPFAALCGTTYETSRNTIITTCTTDLRGRLCANATSFICKTNPFHALCYDASATVFQTARQTAVTNCGDGTTTITEQICADAVQQACEGDSADVFNALCGAYSGQSTQTTACGDNDDDTRCYLAEQINRCADGTETVRCAQVGTGDISTCAADPFAAACVAAGSPFAPYLTAAQATRYAYCGADGVSATDSLCASYRPCKSALDGGETIPAGCGVNFSVELRDGCVVTDAAFLFSTQCDGGQFDTQRSDFCGTDGVNNLFHAKCTADYQDTTARNSFCTDNPFDANCNTNVAYANLRETNCAGAASARHASCVNTSLLVAAGHPTGPTVIVDNPAKYKDSFMTTTITQDDAIAPSFGDLFTAAVTKEVPPNSPEGTQPTVIPEISIDAADIGPRVVGRRGGAGSETNRNDNPDGWAYFTLTRPRQSGDTDSIASTRTSIHATILPTTNLGAPLTAQPATAVWPGHFSSTATTGQLALDFYINYAQRRVGFSSPTRVGIGHHLDQGRGWIADRPAIAVANKIRIDVNWDAMGRLFGFIEVNDDNPATRDGLIVNGLIGQEGLVAVGYSGTNKGGAGGFTASNPDHPTYVPAFVESDVSDEETGVDSNANLVNYEDWLESGAAPSATPSDPRISELLQTSTSTGGRRISGLTNGQNALFQDFSVADFRSRLLRGDAKNGFAVFGEANNFYAGVLHTADLGAPIIQTSGSAVWRGYLVAADGTATTRKVFDLDVTFSSNHDGQVGTLGGKVLNDINNLRSTVLYTIEGRFNARGVISGDIIRSVAVNTVQRTFTTPLSGLIGQEGAIAVFASNDAESKFAGGFVAVPNSAQNVTHDGVWVATHDAGVYGLFPTPRGENHWLPGGVAGSAGGVNGQSRANIAPVSLNDEGNAGFIRLSDATWNRVPLGGSAGNGVAFYSGIIEGTGRRTYYSGLFAQTDLGKPLTQTSGSLVWAGRLDVLQGGPQGQAIVGRRSGDIVLAVNFTNSGGTLTSVFAPSQITSTNYGYTINGSFNTDGFISGQVISRTGSYSSTGYLSGLIGQHGAVAAIVGGNMAGGFVAHAGALAGFRVWPAVRPYRGETPVPGYNTARQRIGHFVTAQTYDDWAYYTGQRYGQLRSVPHNESGQHNAFLHTDPADGNNIPWGNIGQDGAGEHTGRDAIGVGAGFQAAGLKAPAALKGGFSWLAGFWDKASTEIPVATNPLNRGYHAGIFQDTYVGVPLGRTSIQSGSTTAYWSGYFYAHQNETFKNSVNTFGRVNFLVNYGDARRITITYDDANGTKIGGIYEISALDGVGGLEWDERGVISGLISHKDAHVPDGQVTGLIGEAGMVAVFVSRADSGTKPHYGFTGGWVACPLTSRDGVCIP